jgi:hypothetical protein
MIEHFQIPSTRDWKLLREISKAGGLFDRFESALRRHLEIRRLLTCYRNAIEATQARMLQEGVAAMCKHCATKGPGSCCFEGIEDGYDHILLLINLLMGCIPPDNRENPEACFFVGEDGCKLRCRYYFCLHYLCPELQTTLGSEAKQELLKVVGKELQAGWKLEQTLREWLRRQSMA